MNKDERLQQLRKWIAEHSKCAHKRMNVSAMRGCDYNQALLENASRETGGPIHIEM